MNGINLNVVDLYIGAGLCSAADALHHPGRTNSRVRCADFCTHLPQHQVTKHQPRNDGLFDVKRTNKANIHLPQDVLDDLKTNNHGGV